MNEPVTIFCEDEHKERWYKRKKFSWNEQYGEKFQDTLWLQHQYVLENNTSEFDIIILLIWMLDLELNSKHEHLNNFYLSVILLLGFQLFHLRVMAS